MYVIQDLDKKFRDKEKVMQNSAERRIRGYLRLVCLCFYFFLIKASQTSITVVLRSWIICLLVNFYTRCLFEAQASNKQIFAQLQFHTGTDYITAYCHRYLNVLTCSLCLLTFCMMSRGGCCLRISIRNLVSYLVTFRVVILSVGGLIYKRS